MRELELAPVEVAVITTTINVPTVLVDLVGRAPAHLTVRVVVAGDVQTPPEARDLVESLGGYYLGVDDDATTRWDSDDVIGHRSIQRRNLALLHALTLGPDVVVTVDDDNEPHDSVTYLVRFVDQVLRNSVEYLTTSSTGWYNPGVVLNPHVVHRGYPLDQRHVPGACTVDAVEPTSRRVGVAAGLWFGDPDVDATERIAVRPTVRGFRPGSAHRDVVLNYGTWAPFNTQNTAVRWELAPLFQCLVGVGRYDDIWMSYVARAVMDHLGWHVRYGYPLVTQRRNDHDLVQDLEDELLGYRWTPHLVRRLRELAFDPDASTSLDHLARAYDELDDLWSTWTSEANETWLRDARVAVAEGTQRRKERGVA